MKKTAAAATEKHDKAQDSARRMTALQRQHADMSTSEITFRIEQRGRELAEGEGRAMACQKIIDDTRAELSALNSKNLAGREDINALVQIVEGRRL